MSPERPGPLRRDEIVSAARRMLQDSGLESVSLRRLAATLGVTAPALYAHVENKNDLLTAVAEQAFTDLDADFEGVTATDPVERLKEHARLYVRRAIAEPETFAVMFDFRPEAVPPGTPEGTARYSEAPLEQSDVAIREAIAAGQIHPERDPDVTAISLWTCTHGVTSILLIGRHGDEVIDADGAIALLDELYSVVFAGLALPPGS